MVTKSKKNFLFFFITIFFLTTFLSILPTPLYAIECTEYAYQQRPDLAESRPLGNARYWADRAETLHFPVDEHPRVGDIVVFQPENNEDEYNKSYGHVAYVERVENDNSFYVSEANLEGGGTTDNPRHVKKDPSDRFIHRKPDLVVSNIRIYKPGTTEEFTPSAKQTVTFYAVLENNGGYETVPYTVKWFLDGKEVGSGSNPSLAVNTCTNTNVFFNWKATEGNHVIKFEADCNNVVYESIENNNIYQVEFNVTKATWFNNVINGFQTVIDGIVDAFYAVVDVFTGPFVDISDAYDFTTSLTPGEEPSKQTAEVITEEVTVPPPSKPSLTSPYNWYQSLGESPTLRWKGDSNASSYYVIVNSSNTGNIESGWIYSTGWRPNLPNANYVYSWKVKARNLDGFESGWSEERYFSVASTTLKFDGDISFIPPSPSSADEIIILAATSGWGGVGVTLKVSVNNAPDGSPDGEWKNLKELGVPKFNENDAPRWDTSGWSNGTYRIRVEAKGSDDPNWLNSTIIETTYTLIGKDDPIKDTDSAEIPYSETQGDSNYQTEMKNLVIYKSYDPDVKKNVFIAMKTDGTNKNLIYLDDFLVEYGRIKYNLKDANSPFLSSDGRFIICNEGGTWLTHLLDIKDGSLKTLQYLYEDNELDSGSIRRDPCFSPGGETIAVGGFHSGYTDFSVQLCTLLTGEIENAKLKILTDDLNSWVNDPRYSKDGSKIIFNNDNGEIIIVNSDGSGLFNFTETYGYKGEHPAFSPDGNIIVFSYLDIISKIATVDIDGSNFKIIYKSEMGGCQSPSFSSDGNRILFCAPHGDATGQYKDIFSIDLDGNNLVNLTNSAKIDDNEPECVY